MNGEGSLWSPLDPRESLLFIVWVADKYEISPSQAADRIVDLWNEDLSLLATWISSFRETCTPK